jgi:hypothetical protein
MSPGIDRDGQREVELGYENSDDQSPSASPLFFGRQQVRLTAPEERGRPLSEAVVSRERGAGHVLAP